MSIFIIKKKIENNYSIYRRKTVYDKATKNTKILSEIYLGRFIETLEDRHIFYHSKIIKNNSLSFFLENNRDIYDCIINKYLKENSLPKTNKLKNLLRFLFEKDKLLFEKNEVKWQQSEKRYFIEINNTYTCWLKDYSIRSIDINNFNKSRDKEIRFLEYLNDNIRNNIKYGKFKNFILLLKTFDNKLSKDFSDIKIERNNSIYYLYSDLDTENKILISLVNDLWLLKNILINIYSIGKIDNEINEDGSTQYNTDIYNYNDKYNDRIQHMISFCLYINKYFMYHVDKKAYNKIVENPFPEK